MATKRTTRASTGKPSTGKPAPSEPTKDHAAPGKKGPPTRQLLLRIPEDLHKGLRHLSIDKRASINKMLIKVIQDWYDEQATHG